MPDSYERVAGSRVGPWADREATRSALEATTREWTLVRQGKEESVFQVFNGGGWVFGVGVSLPPSGCCVSRGADARRVWCVAPSLTLVLGPGDAGPAT